MTELLKVNYDADRITVSARELYEFLEISERFNSWFDRCLKYGFEKETDFTSVKSFTLVNNGAQRELQDYQLTLDMAKEISMIQRNDKGKQARQYFLTLEKKWNSPEAIMHRALEISKRQIENLMLENKVKDQRIGELEPKADYCDKILSNKGLVTITQIAKDYGMSGVEMNNHLHDLGVQYKQSGQWLLYKDYQDKGYTHSETINIKQKDGTTFVKMNTKWTQKGRLFLYELLKKNDILPIIETS